MPVVEFEESDTVFGREFFTGLFHAIIDKRPIYLDYQRFGKKARTHLLYLSCDPSVKPFSNKVAQRMAVVNMK